MGVDVFAPDGQRGQFFLNGRLFLQPGLAGVEKGGTDHHVGDLQGPLYEGERGIAVQGGPDETGRPGMPVEQHILPGDQHIVEDDQGIHFVEPVGKRVVPFVAPLSGKAAAADEFQIGRTEVADEADRIVAEFRIAPIGDGRLCEGLVGIGSRGFVFRTANNDSLVGFLDDMQQHVRILVLRRQRPVALRIGIGRDMEGIASNHPVNMVFDIL